MAPFHQLRESLIGTWRLSEYRTVPIGNGKPYFPMGHDVDGFLIYTNDGFVSMQLMKQGAPNFADADMARGTTGELSEAMKHSLAYTGRFDIIDSVSCGDLVYEGTVVHHKEVCSFPNWLGDTQKFEIDLVHGNLTLLMARHQSVLIDVSLPNRYFLAVDSLAELTRN